MQTKQDQKLEEVRAILQRLQRISAGAEDDEAPPPPIGNGAQPRQNGRALQSIEPPGTLPAMSAEKTIALIALPIFIAFGAVGWMLWPETPPEKVATSQPAAAPPATASEPQQTATLAVPRTEPSATTPQQRERIDPVATVPAVAVAPVNADAERLGIAQRLMDKGKISEARRVLKSDLAARNAEAALLLARSYDPNSLQLIANADAGAEPGEAERWYRRWAELAAAQGLELDRERLDRIIKSMR